MNDEILKKENPELYRVAREGGTEPAFTGEYVHTKENGMYHCAVCGVPLFSSDTKFDSGSGWPSFTDPATAGSVKLLEDNSHGMHRTEVRCAKCDAHLGHVFPDGPTKNGKTCDRFCINSVSLKHKKKSNTTDADHTSDTTTKTSEKNQGQEKSLWEEIKDDLSDLSDGDGGGDGD